MHTWRGIGILVIFATIGEKENLKREAEEKRWQIKQQNKETKRMGSRIG